MTGWSDPTGSSNFEPLEPRFLLSTVLDLDPLSAAPDSLTFDDPEGDVITLQLDGDEVGFHVAGDFAGMLDMGNAFDTGAGATANIVDGMVESTAKFNVTGTFGTIPSAAEFTFGGSVLGEFNLGTDLDIDLPVTNNANQLTISGGVNQDINVGGRATFLSTGSIFVATTPTTGNFEDGVGTVTGTLTVGTAGGTVVPG